MSKIKHIHLYRNGEVLGNRDLAVGRLKDFLNDNQDSDLDGVAILARYNSTSGDTTIVKTIVGFVYEGSNGTPKSITIFDNEATEGEISNLKTEIENKINEAQVNANAYTDTKIATLDADDSPVDNNFVTSVSESDGKITVQRAAVSSSTKTVLVTKAEGKSGGVSLDVNIDGATIVKNDTNGKISVASAALTQYIGKDAVKVSEVDASNNNKTVSLEIKSGDKVLSQTQDGLSATLSIDYDSNERKLQLKGSSGNVINEIDATAFVKDGMLNDTAVFTASATTQSITFSRSRNKHEYSGLTKENHYLAFEFKISSGESSSYNYEILDATSIIDVYKKGNGLELTDHTFSVKLAQGSENFLTVDGNGVKLSGVKAAIDAAAASAKTEVKKASNDKHINVTSAATENGHVTYTISSVDTASASGLSKEITDRENADKKIRESVGLSADGSHIQTSGNYTSAATTVTGEISALDTQVKENADNITNLNSQVTTINSKINKNAPKGSNAITVTETDNGSTIAVKLSGTDSGLVIKNDGLAINFETLELDCGTY